MRSLAHVEKIVSTYPVAGADRIEMAQVLDYHVMVKKNEFKVGDKVVYIEIDSILPDGLSLDHLVMMKELKTLINTDPDNAKKYKEDIAKLSTYNTIPEFEFLRAKDFEIHAMKMSKFGIVSLGILFSLDILEKAYIRKYGTDAKIPDWTIGQDVTDLLGIKKIEEDEDAVSVPKKTTWFTPVDKKLSKFKPYRNLKKKFFGHTKLSGTWPKNFPFESNEKSAQNVYSKFYELHKDKLFYVTEKMEGQNISFVSIPEKYFFGLRKRNKVFVNSHHRCMRNPERNGFWETVKNLGYDKKIRMTPNVFVRGEHVGPGCGPTGAKRNIYRFPTRMIYVFEVFDILTRKIYSLDELISFCNFEGYSMVPILQRGFKLPPTIQELLAFSNGKSFFSDHLREGIILRCEDDPSISLKVRSPEYLAL